MIEMLPEEYYLQLYRELQPLIPALEAKEREEHQAKEQERRARIHKMYDDAIAKKIAQQKRGEPTDARRESLRLAAARHRQKVKALKGGKFNENNIKKQ